MPSETPDLHMAQNSVDLQQVHAVGARPRDFSVWSAGWFLLFAVALNFDEIRYHDTVGLSSTSVATVPLFNAWTMGWNANRLSHAMHGYWDAPIFYPAEKAFAFSEPQPATLLVAPFVYLSGSAVTGYKAYLVLSVFLNGLMTSILLTRLGFGRSLQVLGGTGMMLLPIIHERIDVIQLVPIWGILWFWMSLHEMVRQPTLKRGLMLGISYSACFMLCIHHALFMTLLLPFSVIPLLPKLIRPKAAVGGLVGLISATILVAPLVIPIYQMTKEHDFARKQKLVARLSAQPQDYLNPTENSLLQIDAFRGSKSRRFCTGWSRMGLALLGIFGGIYTRKRRSWSLFLTLTGLLAFFLSLGPNLQIGEWTPWSTLNQYVPGVGQVRSVYRFAWFVQIAIMLLAVEGLSLIFQGYKRAGNSSLRKLAYVALCAIACLLFVCETWPEKTTRAGVPKLVKQQKWIEFLKTSTSNDDAIACLPFSTGSKIQNYDITTRWMYYGLEHERKMVNGYSGFFPQDYIDLKRLFAVHGPTARGLRLLKETAVSHLVVSRSYCSPATLLKLQTQSLAIEKLFSDQQAGIDIYRLSVTE